MERRHLCLRTAGILAGLKETQEIEIMGQHRLRKRAEPTVNQRVERLIHPLTQVARTSYSYLNRPYGRDENARTRSQQFPSRYGH
jgi:hypothetical protein